MFKFFSQKISLISKFVINFKVQCTVFILLIIYLFFLLRVPMNRVVIDDPYRKLSTVLLPKDYKWQGVKGKNVEVGLYVTNFKEFNIEKNKFIMDCIVWFVFNKNFVDLEKIHTFNIENGKIETKKFSRVIALDGEKVLAQYEIRVDFTTDLNYEHYPFDDHRLSIMFSNFNLGDDSNVIFYTSKENFGLSDNLYIKNWKIINTEVYYGFDHVVLDQKDERKNIIHPSVVYSFMLQKISTRKLVTIFLPLLILTLLALLGLLMPLKYVEGRLAIIISSLSGLLFYRFVIESVMPDIGYFTRTDHVFAFGVVFIFLLLMIEVMVIRRLIVQADFTNSVTSERITLARVVNGYSFFLIVIFYACLLSILILR